MSSEPAASADRYSLPFALPMSIRGLRAAKADVPAALFAILGAPAPRASVALLVGATCALLSLGLRFLATPYIGDGEALLTAFPLVLVATLTAGRCGGWTCLVLCTIGSWYLFIGDRFSFSFGTYEKGILIGTFLAGAFVVQICSLMRKVFREITELRETERLLSRELEHRIKNTLTLVIGISRQTFREGRPLPRALGDFEGQMIALAAAQDLVGRADRQPATIARIAEQSLSPFCGVSAHGRRTLSGPDLTVDADMTVALFLILHELATNSAKYGALSVEAGSVDITWRLGDDRGKRLEMTWTDRGGPPVVPPSHEGFGTQLLRRIITRSLKGAVTLDYPRSGFRATLALPV